MRGPSGLRKFSSVQSRSRARRARVLHSDVIIIILKRRYGWLVWLLERDVQATGAQKAKAAQEAC